MSHAIISKFISEIFLDLIEKFLKSYFLYYFWYINFVEYFKKQHIKMKKIIGKKYLAGLFMNSIVRYVRNGVKSTRFS